MAGSADPSLDALRVRLAPAIAEAAAFDGWSMAAVEVAAQASATDPELARFAFRDGPMAMIATWIASIDVAMAAALPCEALAALPIRQRIRKLVWFRLEAIAGQEEALRRAQAIMAMPQNVAATLAQAWSSADKMWRLAGDTAADFNHYTKRTTLGAIYAAVLAVWVGDTSEGKAETAAFLDRRIEGIMRFEKAKAKLLAGDEEHFSLVRFLGRLRYPAR